MRYPNTLIFYHVYCPRFFHPLSSLCRVVVSSATCVSFPFFLFNSISFASLLQPEPFITSRSHLLSRHFKFYPFACYSANPPHRRIPTPYYPLSSTLVTVYMSLILGLFGFSSGPFFLLYSAIFVSLSTIPTLPQCIFICAFTKPLGRNVAPPRAHPQSEDHFQSVALIDCLEFVSCKLTHSFGIVVFLAINYKSPRSPVSSYVEVEDRTRTARAIT